MRAQNLRLEYENETRYQKINGGPELNERSKGENSMLERFDSKVRIASNSSDLKETAQNRSKKVVSGGGGKHSLKINNNLVASNRSSKNKYTQTERVRSTHKSSGK